MKTETFKYDNRIVRAFAIATMIWSVVGMCAGLLAAVQLFWPEANLSLKPSGSWPASTQNAENWFNRFKLTCITSG